jgi:hypothetical protein
MAELSPREMEALSRDRQGHRIALYMCAAHCQGGHSDAGAAAAFVLGVSFPLLMTELVGRARSEGYNPAVLWPHLRMSHGASNAFLTGAELEAASGKSAFSEMGKS